MSLTITEKQHWKERIATRIDAEIKKLKATDLLFFQRIHQEARRCVGKKLGIAAAQDRLLELDKQITALKDERDRVQAATAGKLREGHIYHPSTVIESAIQELLPSEEERLMAEHPLGKRLVDLEREKELLLDTVWLATSSPQIRELWQQVDALLGMKATSLQAKILQRKKPS